MPRIAVLGLGYAGLPVVLAFARRFAGTVAFDVDAERVRALASGTDPSGETAPDELLGLDVAWTSDPAALEPCDVFILCVPTPIDDARRPDLGPLVSACEIAGAALAPGALVVVQSTVYPGATEEVCGPALARASGLTAGRDFALAHAPERINPGDPAHGFKNVSKLVAAQDERALRRVVELYEAVIDADVVPIASLKVAETAKLLENVQRDLNIALMNELALLCDRLDVDTRAVIDAAATKWNFHRYQPGLVGGHCVGVDPYYLTAKAEELGLAPEVVLAGRRINNRMGEFVAEKTLALLRAAGVDPAGARVAVLGAAFKPDVADPRNSRVPELVRALRAAGAEVRVHDPRVPPAALARETGLEHADEPALEGAAAVVLATPHRGLDGLALRLASGAQARVLVDVGGVLDPGAVPPGVRLWRL